MLLAGTLVGTEASVSEQTGIVEGVKVALKKSAEELEKEEDEEEEDGEEDDDEEEVRSLPSSSLNATLIAHLPPNIPLRDFSKIIQ